MDIFCIFKVKKDKSRFYKACAKTIFRISTLRHLKGETLRELARNFEVKSVGSFEGKCHLGGEGNKMAKKHLL